MPTNPVGTWVDPAFGSQTGTPLKTNYDNAHNVAKRFADGFAPHEASPPDLTVVVDAGFTWDGVTLTEVAQQTSAALVAPSVNPRIDRVVVDRVTGVLQVETGAEAPVPVPPAIPAGKDPVAQIAWQTSTPAIVNAIITDERADSPDLETPLPENYLTGLGMTLNSGDPLYDIDFATGSCRSSDNLANIFIETALLKKLDEAWAVGNNQGLWSSEDITDGTTVTFTDNGGGNDFVTIDSGTWTATPTTSDAIIVTGGLNAGAYIAWIAPTSTVITVQTGQFVADAGASSEIRVVPLPANGAFVYVFAIKRTDTGVTDFMAAASATAPFPPPGYDRFRRIGCLFVDSSSTGPDIVPFVQRADRFMFDAVGTGIVIPSTTASLTPVRVPPIPGMVWLGHVSMSGNGTLGSVRISSPLRADITPTLSNSQLTIALTSVYASASPEIPTDTGQIRHRASVGLGRNMNIGTGGYIDDRGRDG